MSETRSQIKTVGSWEFKLYFDSSIFILKRELFRSHTFPIMSAFTSVLLFLDFCLPDLLVFDESVLKFLEFFFELLFSGESKSIWLFNVV